MRARTRRTLRPAVPFRPSLEPLEGRVVPVQFTRATYCVNENHRTLDLPLIRNGQLPGTRLAFQITITGLADPTNPNSQPAQPGLDFLIPDGTPDGVVFAPTDVFRRLLIPIRTSVTQPTDQFDHTFQVTLSAGGVVQTQAVVTILDLQHFINPSQRYVREIYCDLLQRDSEALVPGVPPPFTPPQRLDPAAQNWVQILDSTGDRGGVVRRILGSPEFRTDEVLDAYFRFLGRPADPTAFVHINNLNQGVPIDQVEAVFLASPEYFAVRAGNDPTQFVNAVFRDLLARDFVPGENTLPTLAATNRAQVVQIVFASPEFRTVLVQSLHQRFLDRPPDAMTLGMLTDRLRLGQTREEIIAQLVSTDEYFFKM